MAPVAPTGSDETLTWFKKLSRKIKASWRKIKPSHVFAGVFTAVAAIGTVLAALYARGQIQAADQQKIASQQQELLMLVVDIEQEPTLLTQATAGLTGNTLTAVQTEYQNELTSYAQSAQLIINSLNSEEVPNFEYVQVGKALSATGNNAEAISYFQIAAGAKNDAPDTVAAALRNEAVVRYNLNEAVPAHQEMIGAVQAFDRQFPDVTVSDSDNNVAQSYLADASSQMAIRGCQIAKSDIDNAEKVLGQLPERDETTLNGDVLKSDNAEYRKRLPLVR